MKKYDENGKLIYFENSDGIIRGTSRKEYNNEN